MATSEIDKLERRYAENPHGLTFAPLAEVHRKNGDITRALELLRIGLELHPNYIPASIVLGRCHQDLGDLAGAEEAFAHVLRLDDENVIALKSLADINERQERLDDAERWLHRLVSVDRSNDEARQQLQRVEAAKAKTSRSPPAPSTTAEVPHEVALVDAPPGEPPRPARGAETRSEPAELAPLDLTDDLKKEAVEPVLEPSALKAGERKGPADSPPESLVPNRDAPVVDPGPLPGLETAEFEPPKGNLGPLGLEIEVESDVVLNSSGASEFTVPDASQDLAALAAKYNASRPRTPGRRASDRTAAEGREAAAKVPIPPVAPEPVAPVPRPQPVAETQPATLARPYAARETKGQSIATFFQALLVARPPSDVSPAQSDPSGPARPDPDIPVASSGPKEETASPASAAASTGKDGLVSFDDFFGSAGGSSAASAGGEPGKDDLDQFHSWLQNLKR